MGLIQAAKNAITGTLHDQWLDAIKCDNMNDNTLMVRVTPPTGQISKGSRIIVQPGQLALIVDTGVIKDGTAEPGAYTFDDSTSPSFFGGQFGPVFKEMWERFKYNGTPARGQAVYFFNATEFFNNKFGTPAAIPYKDWGHPNFNPRTNSLYPMAVEIKVFGKYTFKIENPFVFMNNVAGTTNIYYKDQLVEQIRSEFISVFRNTLAELGSDEYKIEAMDLPHKDDEIITAMKAKNYDEPIKNRGIILLSVAVESIKFTEESNVKIREYELSDAYTQSGHLAGSAGRAMENAASNSSGAMTGFMGFGMATTAVGNMGVNPGAAMQSQKEQIDAMNAQKASDSQSENTSAQASDGWACECGTSSNNGKFCSECGKEKPETSTNGWTCSCGAINGSKFCSECGNKAPIDGICSKCGFKSEKPFKFCPECGASS